MKVWKLLAPYQLEEQNADLPSAIQDRQVKIKITKLLLTEQDYHAYNGDLQINYPIIPARFAIGRIIDGYEKFGLEKNARIYLQDNLSCNICDNCIDNEECLDLKAAGIDYNGFLREFLITNFENTYTLPSQISDNEALFISPLSLCLEVVDKLDIEIGTQVLIAGANYLGILLAQLLIYKKAIPILIDTDTHKLEVAKKAGIYYTFLKDDNLYEKIKNITGGKMVKKSVFTNSYSLQPNLVQEYTTYGGLIIYAGFHFLEMYTSIKSTHAKSIMVISIKNGSKNKDNAINLLANKHIDVSVFSIPSQSITKIHTIYHDALEALKDKNDVLTIIDMLE